MSSVDGGTAAGDDVTPSRPTRMTRGRAVLVVLALGLLAVGVAALPWARATVPTVLAERDVTVTGAQGAPVTTGIGLLVLATGLAVALGGRWVTRLGAVLLAAGGAAYVVTVVEFVLDPLPGVLAAAAAVSGVQEIAGDPALTPWPYVAGVVGVLVLLSAFLTSRVPTSPAGRRFERSPAAAAPARPPARDERTRAMDDWDALGRGEDPSTRDDG